MDWRAGLAVIVLGTSACGGSEPYAVVIDPTPLQVRRGGTLALTAHVLNASGDTIGGAVVTWSSENPAVASVSSSGTVSGEAVGSTSIVAHSGGAVGSAPAEVFPSVTGLWSGRLGATEISLSIVEHDDGALTGSGSFAVPGLTAPVVVSGIHDHPLVRIFMAPQDFLTVRFEGSFQREDQLSGAVTQSGFNGEPLVLSR